MINWIPLISENIPTTEEAFALAETPVKYNFPVSVTLCQQLQVKMPGYESSIMDCIKIVNKLVFIDFYGSKLVTCNADGTGEHHIPLYRKPLHITEIDSDTVAVSCTGRTIQLINIYTDKVINSIKPVNTVVQYHMIIIPCTLLSVSE